MTFIPEARPTLVGSLPVSDHKEAVDIIMEYIDEIPLWPQLPCYPEERLLSQYAEGLPGIRTDSDGGVSFDTSSPEFEEELLAFFEKYLEISEAGGQIDGPPFAFSDKTGRGIKALTARLEERQERPLAIKGQVTGPFTMLTGIKDENGKMAWFNPMLREAVNKSTELKIRYQVELLKRYSSNVIIFLDEPALSGFGSSAMVGIPRDETVKDLTDAVNAIHNAGGMAGVHVCANTDWSILLDTPVDILSFDAYGFFDRIMLFKTGLEKFIESGKIIAWGLVPTLNSEDLEKEDIDSMKKRWNRCVEEFGADPEIVRRQALITPSCGTGLLSRELAVKAIKLTRQLSDAVRSGT
jgi:methionine synthase II (cobalamin-independent)